MSWLTVRKDWNNNTSQVNKQVKKKTQILLYTMRYQRYPSNKLPIIIQESKGKILARQKLVRSMLINNTSTKTQVSIRETQT